MKWWQRQVDPGKEALVALEQERATHSKILEIADDLERVLSRLNQLPEVEQARNEQRNKRD